MNSSSEPIKVNIRSKSYHWGEQLGIVMGFQDSAMNQNPWKKWMD